MTRKQYDLAIIGGGSGGLAAAQVATGSHPLIPTIAGLEEVGYLTNEDIFNLLHLPASHPSLLSVRDRLA